MTAWEKVFSQGGILGLLGLQAFVVIKYGIPLLRESVAAILGFNLALAELREAIESLRVEVLALRVKVDHICLFKSAGLTPPCDEGRTGP
jgi:hypothetical protein